MIKILNFFIFFSVFKQCLDYIVYNLETEGEKNSIESLLSFYSTYTTLDMGTPRQKVNFYFDLFSHEIILTEKNCKNTNLFDKNNSTTFKYELEITPSPTNDMNKYLITDNLYFNTSLKFNHIVKIEKYPFYSSIDKNSINNKLCGTIGLSIIQYNIDLNKLDHPEIKNFTDALSRKNAQKYDDFSFFHYNNKDYLIYSIFLMYEFPNLLPDVKMVEWLYPCLRKNSRTLYWEISMKEIFYNNIHSNPKNFLTFEINPLFELIVGMNDYRTNITRDYFNSYIKNGICSVGEYPKYNFMVIGCDEEKFGLKQIKKFPTLYLSNVGINHIFDLKGEELFINLNKKWYFKIVFPKEEYEVARWILGRTFLRKYPVIFSPYNKLIGFYVKPNKGIININQNQTIEEEKIIEKINSNNKNFFSNDTIGYIKIIVVAIIFMVVGLYIGKKIFFPRRKRANELVDDYYQYDSEKKNGNKMDINTEKNNSTVIEMNSKLGVK